MKTIHVNKTYAMGEVEVKALIDVNLELYESEFVVLLGHSGSGKSTLLNILGGLDRPTSGELYFAGERIDQYSDRELTLFRRENIGFIFQMYNLIPRLSGVENVELVTEISSNPMDDDGDVVVDNESFASLASKNQHLNLLLD